MRIKVYDIESRSFWLPAKMINMHSSLFMRNLIMLFKPSQSQSYTGDLQWLKHRWHIYYDCFELGLESLEKNPLTVDLG